MATWSCNTCNATGDGVPVEQCPTCEDWDIKLLEDGYREYARSWHRIDTQIHDLARYKLDVGCDSYTLDDDSVTVTWEALACARGCCGYETRTHTFPLKYLWMSWDEIDAAEEARKAAKAKAEADQKKAEEIRQAEAKLAAARKKAETAAQDAARDLENAAAQLAALRSGL